MKLQENALTWTAKPASRMLFAASVLIGGVLLSALDDSETPMSAAPQICKAVVTMSMVAKAAYWKNGKSLH